MPEENVLWEGRPSFKAILAWILSPKLLNVLAFIISLLVVFYVVATLSYVMTLPSAIEKTPSSASTHGPEEKHPFAMLQAIMPTIVLVVVLFFAVYFAYLYLLWRSYSYRITNKGAYFEGGVLIRKKKFVPFYKITNVEISQTIVERLFGLYTVNIQTAGTGALRAEIRFEGLENPNAPEEVLKREIIKIQQHLKESGE